MDVCPGRASHDELTVQDELGCYVNVIGLVVEPFAPSYHG